MSLVDAPLIVVALGGNAISPPQGDLSFPCERSLIDRAASELARLAERHNRLLIVHGNGPQVGRLLAVPDIGNPDYLDIFVAQTQGELGYLIAEALDRHLGVHSTVAVVSRVLVSATDPAFIRPTKPVGPVLPAPPEGVISERTPTCRGWRRVVASPQPLAVVEQDAIAALLRAKHVVAGGGGGIALSGSPAHQPQAAVIDKDWVAALLAVNLLAIQLVYVTDVPCAFERFGEGTQAALPELSVGDALRLLESGAFAPGSMAPKVESAVRFVMASRRPATITTIGAVDAALSGRAGTTIHA